MHGDMKNGGEGGGEYYIYILCFCEKPKKSEPTNWYNLYRLVREKTQENTGYSYPGTTRAFRENSLSQ